MAIKRWNPTQEPTPLEEMLLKRLKRTRKLFRFLREHRQEIFDDAFQEQLEAMYRATGAGKPPLAPAQMAMAMLLQGYVSASDAEAVELTVVDLRWQLVLGLLGASKPAFSQGALHDFRQRMIRHDMDRRLLERTAEVAKQSKGFDYRKLPKDLRVAIDAAPLVGAGRVEDTINLLGHAARNIVQCAAVLMRRDPAEVAGEAGIPLLAASSIKAGLDRTWTEPGERQRAVRVLHEQIQSLLAWLPNALPSEVEEPPLETHVATLRRILAQDLEPPPEGTGVGAKIRKGVAKDRQVSVEDTEMRHGRKSKSKLFNGYKRHIALDLDYGVILACAITAANKPEGDGVPSLSADISAQGSQIVELYIDRAYINTDLVQDVLDRSGTVACRPWRTTNKGLFAKGTHFTFDTDYQAVTCPAGVTIPVQLGKTAKFPKATCLACALRESCTTSKKAGRSLQVSANEPLQYELREQAKTPEGRALLRRRVPVEHRLAHVAQRTGKRARYVGSRNNLFDLRRASSIQNLECAQRASYAVDEPLEKAA